MTHAHATWTSRSVVATSTTRRESGLAGLLLASGVARHLAHRLRFGHGLGGNVDKIRDLVVAEAGEVAEVASEVDRALVVLAAEAAEAEQLVDGALEVERLLLALGIVRR